MGDYDIIFFFNFVFFLIEQTLIFCDNGRHSYICSYYTVYAHKERHLYFILVGLGNILFCILLGT